jgi:hypothetical protein
MISLIKAQNLSTFDLNEVSIFLDLIILILFVLMLTSSPMRDFSILIIKFILNIFTFQLAQLSISPTNQVS